MCGLRSLRTVLVLVLAGFVVWNALVPSADAQMPTTAPAQSQPAAPARPVKEPAPAKPAREAETKVQVPVPQNVTLTGRLVDLHSFMTDSYPAPDRAKTTAERLKAGVPAGLDTAAGLILLGSGLKNAADKLVPLAYEEVDVKGKLHYRRGARYLEFTSIAKAKAPDTRGLPAKPPTLGGAPATKPAGP
jgi:hypothetical protein